MVTTEWYKIADGWKLCYLRHNFGRFNSVINVDNCKKNIVYKLFFVVLATQISKQLFLK